MFLVTCCSTSLLSVRVLPLSSITTTSLNGRSLVICHCDLCYEHVIMVFHSAQVQINSIIIHT